MKWSEGRRQAARLEAHSGGACFARRWKQSFALRPREQDSCNFRTLSQRTSAAIEQPYPQTFLNDGPAVQLGDFCGRYTGFPSRKLFWRHQFQSRGAMHHAC